MARKRNRPLIHVTIDPRVAEFISFCVRNGFAKTKSEVVERAIRSYAWQWSIFIRFAEKYLESTKKDEKPEEDRVYRVYIELLKELADEKVELAVIYKPEIFAKLAEKLLDTNPKVIEELRKWGEELMKI